MQRTIQGLPPSFHETFFPDRRHLSALLKLAKNGYSGTIDTISADSGIPTGRSSGKVLPHLKYAHAMGITTASAGSNGVYTLQLTPLGRLFAVEDPLLHEPLTQLILHLMLSRPIGGAAAWHVLFGRSRLALGRVSSVEAATSFLVQELGNSSSLPGPLFTTYREEASFARTGMLTVEKNVVLRGALPMLEEFYWAYACTWLAHWELTAPAMQQLPLSELENLSRFFESSGWMDKAVDDFLAWTTAQGITSVDRQTGAPLIMKIKSSDELIAYIYSDLL
ncbi:hypothetical protein [Pigmentiphaga litoralis]|uniref:DUF4007 family protein n=1 Tax=Pigmentiphaga litoralis TaxID=516702 RepID=A0A7Y9IPY1_9BURK|nr:hypothetical protein [Pigmentiphaga litoralis]NYE25606.1 hypothetical protein [Pigmentiphaga litoralis]NYE80782.1 hypothetical protein [Pigmentiphaga litoralis]